MFRLFKKNRKNKQTVSDRYFELTVKEVVQETEDTSTLRFQQPGKVLDYKPGQFLTLILPIEKQEVRRSYSLSSSPHVDEFPAITVKRVEAGVVSNYLNDHMKVGDVFTVMEPAGHFTPTIQESNNKQYVLFAAGSGITPVISIIKSILKREIKSRVALVYQNRSASTVIFDEQLNKLQDKYRSRFSQVRIYSQPDPDWKGYSGRMNSATTSDILMDIASNKIDRAEYFLCGPTEFMQTVFNTLTEFEVPEKQIHKESFFLGELKSPAPTIKKKDDQEIEVKIQLDGETYQVQVPSNKSILEAALDQDIDMPFSCQSGLCTACRGKLLSGHVQMDEDDGLSEEELNDGFILNCVSRPTGPGVEIEIC